MPETYNENPELQRPSEPCNAWEHPARWAHVARWEQNRADRAERKISMLVDALKQALEYINDDDPVCIERHTRNVIEKALQEVQKK